MNLNTLSESDLDNLHPLIIYNLCKRDQHEQGSEEWLNSRVRNAKNGEISASRAAPYVKLGNKETATLAYQRQTKQKFRQENDIGRQAMDHGIYNESFACDEYQKICRPSSDILFFGLLRHCRDTEKTLLPESRRYLHDQGMVMFEQSMSDEDFASELDTLRISGSPDGATPGNREIRDASGNIIQFAESPALVEIKCPFKRNFTGDDVPQHYLVQVQQCMHIMRLESTDFIHFHPEGFRSMPQRITVMEVVRDPEWWREVAVPGLEMWSNHIRNFEIDKTELGEEQAILNQPEICKKHPRKRRVKRDSESEEKKQKS